MSKHPVRHANNFKGFTLKVLACLDAIRRSTTLGFVGRIDRLDCKVIASDGRSQLGWTCTDGKWKIRHELNYAWVVEPETIQSFLGKTEVAR